MLYTLVIFLLLPTNIYSEWKEEAFINTPLGKIIGKTVLFNDIKVRTFLSIPYAKPPVGNKRFKKPDPIEPWSKPLQAKNLPPACVQHSSNPFPWLDDSPEHSEDCLYLNIWVPTTASTTKKRPVMFFIHGGGFRISSSRLDYYDGRVLAALGDVVVVTINYRLAVLGFLYFGIEEAPGNMGIHDMYEALKWVNSNIGHFGGDRNRITLFGQSAGAIASGMFMTSPMFNGMFQRAIMESGSAAALSGDNNDKDTMLSQLVAKAVGCAKENSNITQKPEDTVKCLRGMDALHLTKVLGKVNTNPQSGYFPRYGDKLISHNARLSLINGSFRPVDVLIGANQNEGAIPVTKAHADIFGFFGDETSEINKTYGEFILQKYFSDFPNTEAVIQHYLGNLNDEDDILYHVQAAIGDYSRICPPVYLAEIVSQQKRSNVYFYYFQHRPSNSPFAPWMGTVHFDELPFVFGYPMRYPMNYTAYEQELSLEMLYAWTSFATNGVPDITWPHYSKETHLYKDFQLTKNVIKTGPRLENCNFFRKYFGL